MRHIHFLILLLVSACFNHAIAQDMPTKGHIYTSVVGNNSEPVIYNSVNLNTYELLTTNIQVSKDDNLQKIVFAPFKLLRRDVSGFLGETRINIAQKSGISTLGIGFGFDNSSPYSKRGITKLNSAFENFPSLPVKETNENDYEYASRESKYYYRMDSIYAETYKSLLENSFKVTLGYNISLFEIVGGDKVDRDNDNISDNYNNIESNNLSLGFTYVISLQTAVNLSTHFSSKFSSAKENEKKVDYWGGSLSFAHGIIELNKNYKSTPDYLKSLFVPSIVAGFSLEYQKATKNESFAKDGITEILAFTPFLEFKINPKNQFRIGIPIIQYTGINKEISLGSFMQWTLQIAKVE